MIRALLLLLFASPSLVAQETFNILPEDSELMKWDGQLRFRAMRWNRADLTNGTDKNIVDSRLRIGVASDWTPYISSYVSAKALIADSGDHFEALLDLSYIDFKELWGGFDTRIGRFDLNLGDERMVSSASWWNAENAFDGFQLSQSDDFFSWQIWESKAVESEMAVGGEGFYGFASTFAFEHHSLETYYLDREYDSSDDHETTFGVRGFGTTFRGLAWNVHGAYQIGDRTSDSSSQRISAYAFAADFDYELDGGHHMGLSYQIASGAEDDGDDRDERFRAPFGDATQHLGRAGVVTYSNISALSVRYRLDWNQRWDFHVDAHSFSRFSGDDLFYTHDGSDLAAFGSVGGSDDMGNEFDFYLTGQLLDQLQLQMGLTVFRADSSFQANHSHTMLWLLTELTF